MREMTLSIRKICIAYLIVWTISPPLSIDLVYRVIAVVAAVVWMLDELYKSNLSLSKTEAYSLLFLSLVIVVAIVKGDVLQPIATYMMIIAYIMFCRNTDNWDELQGLQYLALVLLIIWNIRTYSVLQTDSHIARLIVRNDIETYKYLRQGVGGYGHIICQTIITPIVFSWILEARFNHKFKCLIGLAYFVSFLLVLSVASYAIPILATLIGVIIYFVGKGQRVWTYIVVSIVVAITIFILIGYVDSIREWLLNLFPSNTTRNKINDLLMSINGGELQGSFQSRFQRYIVPIESFFLKFPIIGALWGEGSGGHSLVLDSFGQYGLFGGWIICKMLFSVPDYYRKNCIMNIKLRRTSIAFTSTLFISMLLDSWTISCAFMLFIVAPLMMEDIKTWNEERAKGKEETITDSKTVKSY